MPHGPSALTPWGLISIVTALLTEAPKTLDARDIVDTGRPPRASRVPLWMQPRRPGDRRSLSRSATRALDVLELFGQERRSLRAIEIAKALGLHPSTANQLLKTMVDSAHLTFDAVAKSYLPSPRLGRFGGWMTE